MISIRCCYALWFLMLAVLSAPALAQKDGKIQLLIPDRIERPVKEDDSGLQQWAEWKPEDCPNCKGAKLVDCPHCARFEGNEKCIECQMKKKATCRPCAGLGTIQDPLEKALCPGCLGASFVPCLTCGGRGGQKVEGSGKKVLDCVSCKGEGGFKCTICNGTRLVEVATFKPPLKEQKAAEPMMKACEQIDLTVRALEGIQPTGKNSRKEVKELNKILAMAPAQLTPLKRSPKALEDLMSKLYAGSVFMGHEDHEAEAMKLWVSNSIYYLKTQKRVLEICIARVKFNEKAGEKKDE